MKLQESFDAFIRHGLYLRGWSPKTAVIYKRAFASYQRSLTEDGGTLSKASLEAWVVWMRTAQACGSPNKRNMSPAGANIYIRAMNAYCAWLKEEGHSADQIVLKQVKAPLKPICAFTEAEIRALTALRPKGDCQRRTWSLVQVLLDTGCRVGELLDLKAPDVDFDNCLLQVGGKGGKSRKVPFSLEGRKVLFRHLGSRKGYVFAARGGTRLMHRNVYRDVIALCRKAGIQKRVHPHLTRHTFACHFMRNGGSIYTLSRILGHSSVSTTQVYVRGLGIEDFREEHQRLSPLSRR